MDKAGKVLSLSLTISMIIYRRVRQAIQLDSLPNPPLCILGNEFVENHQDSVRAYLMNNLTDSG